MLRSNDEFIPPGSCKIHTALCFVLALAVTTHAASLCPPSDFNFFPENTTNQPGGWTKAKQTEAGSDCDGHLLPIATYGFPKPLLHFQPYHSLLSKGSAVSSRYAAGYALLQLSLQHAATNSSSGGTADSSNVTISTASKGSSSRRSNQQSLLAKNKLNRPAFRRLMSQNSTMLANDSISNSTNTTDPANSAAIDTGNWTVDTPALYNITVTANGRLWFKAGPYNVSNGDIPVVGFEADVSQGRRDLFDPAVFKEVRSVAVGSGIFAAICSFASSAVPVGIPAAAPLAASVRAVFGSSTRAVAASTVTQSCV